MRKLEFIKETNAFIENKLRFLALKKSMYRKKMRILTHICICAWIYVCWDRKIERENTSIYIYTHIICQKICTWIYVCKCNRGTTYTHPLIYANLICQKKKDKQRDSMYVPIHIHRLNTSKDLPLRAVGRDSGDIEVV